MSFLALVWRNLVRHRTRTVLTVVGIGIGITTVIALTALENVQVPMFELGVGRRERVRRASELLARVGLSARARSRPAQLSGGERQRVAIARALANEPPLLLADEPTGSLDSAAGRQVLALLDELRAERGTTLVVVTHDAGVAARADRVVQMLDGRSVLATERESPTAPMRGEPEPATL